ncbi:MAG: hypothetical protein ACRDRZ_15860 [Pseudonocardiaceae bacterium]
MTSPACAPRDRRGELALNVLLCVLIVVLLRPGLAEAAANGRLVADGAAAPLPVGQLAFPRWYP